MNMVEEARGKLPAGAIDRTTKAGYKALVSDTTVFTKISNVPIKYIVEGDGNQSLYSVETDPNEPNRVEVLPRGIEKRLTKSPEPDTNGSKLIKTQSVKTDESTHLKPNRVRQSKNLSSFSGVYHGKLYESGKLKKTPKKPK